MVNLDLYQFMIYHHLVNYMKNVFVLVVQMLLVFTLYKRRRSYSYIFIANFPSRLQLYLRMTSVQYIHTQRFLMDLIHFFDQFHQNQDCYNRIRSAAAGQVISCSAGRSTGIELDIEAESPILNFTTEYASQ